jgi:hypothetical protein
MDSILLRILEVKDILHKTVNILVQEGIDREEAREMMGFIKRHKGEQFKCRKTSEEFCVNIDDYVKKTTA